MFNAYLTSKFFLQKNVFYFFSPLLHNGIQISYSLSFSSLDTPIPPQCPYMSPFLSKSPTAKFNATSAGGMQLTAVDVCSPIARLLLNLYYIILYYTRWLRGFARVPYYAPNPCHIHPGHNCRHIKSCHPSDKQYTGFIIYTCSLFFICNNKVLMARAALWDGL